jgi:hypothetical protein
MVSSSLGKAREAPVVKGDPRSLEAVESDMDVVAERRGSIGVEVGYAGDIGVFESRGSTRAFQGPWNGLLSMYSSASDGMTQSQLGSE